VRIDRSVRRIEETSSSPVSGRNPRRSRLRKGREAILDAATALFAEHGFNDTDTQALAEKLGVGNGSLYRHFASKGELFLAVVDRVMRRMRGHIDASIAEVDTPLDRLAVAIRTYLGFFASQPEYVELLIRERALFRDREKPTYFEYRERSAAQWRERYRSQMDEGRLREMPRWSGSATW